MNIGDLHAFTVLFLFLLFLTTVVEFYLSWRQMRQVKLHRESVPTSFVSQVSLEEHQKAADYTVANVRLGFGSGIFEVLLLLCWTLGGGLELLDTYWRGLGLHSVLIGTGFILSLAVMSTVLDMPFSLYSTFVVEQRFGFNRTTPATFLSDLAKQFLLLLLIGGPLISLVLWLMSFTGSYWWLYVWVVWFGFSLLMLWAYPVIIAPMFNKFTPLKDDALVNRITDLLKRCGFVSNGVFVMDGSKRSSHGNAYFSGLGAKKRIVFFDTLLESLSEDEIEAVLAHELGHFHHRHIRKRLLLMACTSFIGLAVLARLIDQEWFYQALGLSTPSDHLALVLFMLVLPIFTFFIQPLFAYGMRRQEFEADRFAAGQTDANEMIQALVKLYRENASTLTPDHWHSVFYDSHPPAPLRIDHLKRFSRDISFGSSESLH